MDENFACWVGSVGRQNGCLVVGAGGSLLDSTGEQMNGGQNKGNMRNLFFYVGNQESLHRAVYNCSTRILVW